MLSKLLSVIAASCSVLMASPALGFDFTKVKNKAAPSAVSSPSTGGVVLSRNNLIVMRSEISEQTVSEVLLTLSRSTSPEVYLYLASPGGSVIAGARLVDYLLNTDKKVTCVVDYAASMAFIILQACHDRVVTQTSILMQHQATWGVGGRTEQNEAFIAFIRDVTTKLDKAQAARIGIPLEEFNRRVTNDWWLFGTSALEAKAADRLSSVTCTKELVEGTDIEMIMTFMGPVYIHWSSCPLATYPIKIVFPMGSLDDKFMKDFNNKLDFRRLMSVNRNRE